MEDLKVSEVYIIPRGRVLVVETPLAAADIKRRLGGAVTIRNPSGATHGYVLGVEDFRRNCCGGDRPPAVGVLVTGFAEVGAVLEPV